MPKAKASKLVKLDSGSMELIHFEITPGQLKTARKLLKQRNEIICVNAQTFVKMLLVGKEMLDNGEDVKAKITPPTGLMGCNR